MPPSPEDLERGRAPRALEEPAIGAPGGPGQSLFRKVGEVERYHGSLITVVTETLETRSGDRFERDVVHHPGAVVIVPVTAEGNVLMVRQFRAAIGGDLLEVPAGKRDVDGESPEQTAARELAEEVGKAAGRIELLARFYNSPGFCDEFTHLYLATELVDVPVDRQGAEEQEMTVVEIPIRDYHEYMKRGDIVDAKSVIGIVLAAATGIGA